MSDPAPKPPPSKFARYRQRKRANGKRLLRMWVPDVNAPGFQEEIERQVALMNKAPEQGDTLTFFEAIEREDGWPE